MFKKLLLIAALFGVSVGVARADTFKPVNMSTSGTLQAGTVGYSMHIASGTIRIFTSTSATITNSLTMGAGSLMTAPATSTATFAGAFNATGSSITFGTSGSTIAVNGIIRIVNNPLDLNSNRIVNVASATAVTDAPRFSQVSIVQMVSTNTTTNSSNNTNTFANTKLCGAIVTRYANTQIWLVAEQPTFTNNPASAEIRFTRNGSALGNTHLGSYANLGSLLFGNSGIYLGTDTTAVAAGTTLSYCTQIRSTSGGTNVGTGDGSAAYNQQLFMIEVNP